MTLSFSFLAVATATCLLLVAPALAEIAPVSVSINDDGKLTAKVSAEYVRTQLLETARNRLQGSTADGKSKLQVQCGNGVTGVTMLSMGELQFQAGAIVLNPTLQVSLTQAMFGNAQNSMIKWVAGAGVATIKTHFRIEVNVSAESFRLGPTEAGDVEFASKDNALAQMLLKLVSGPVRSKIDSTLTKLLDEVFPVRQNALKHLLLSKVADLARQINKNLPFELPESAVREVIDSTIGTIGVGVRSDGLVATVALNLGVLFG